MVQFDNQARQIKVKIVYYGPALGGKTTCLQHIHRVTDPERRTKLYSLNTASDRTLFFDLLGLNLGQVRGYRLLLQLYTVPGQVQYNATRRAVLSGADGVVFVADSQSGQRQANRDSLANLRDNLAANGISQDDVPLVLQYNKRDLDGLLSIDQLEQDLNPLRVPSYGSVALDGEGVVEAFTAISERTLVAVADRLGLGGGPQVVDTLVRHVRETFAVFSETPAGVTAEAAREQTEVTRPEATGAADRPLEPDDLVGEAVRANVAMTDLTARLDQMRTRLERKVVAMTEVARLGRSLASVRAQDEVLDAVLEATTGVLRARAATVVSDVDASGLVLERSRGVSRDPLLDSADLSGPDLLRAVVDEGRPRLVAAGLEEEAVGAVAAVRSTGCASAVVAPLAVRGDRRALLVAYGDPRRPELDEDDLQVLSLLAATAQVGLAAAQAWADLERLNSGLEEEVAARTRQLDATYRDLVQVDEVKDELLSRVTEELRAPVDDLLSASRLLEAEGEAGGERTRQLAAVIRERAGALTTAVESLRQAAALAAPQASRSFRETPVHDLLRRALAPLRDLALERSTKLQLLASGELRTIVCEPPLMEVALRAVVKNALQASEPGSEVKVEVRRAGQPGRDGVELRVLDSGAGIPADELPRVFEPFFQGAEAGRRAPDGIGLGLTIARRVAEAHGGTILVRATPGGGTTVVMSLPQKVG